MEEGSKKAIIAAFFANLGIAVSKLAGFLITGSASLLAEAAHSLADTGNQGLLLFGSRRSKRSADLAHPFGYGPERYFWSFVVALVLFSMGGLFALYEGINKLSSPHAVENPAVAFAILGFAVVLESFSLRTAVREARHEKKRTQGWWNFIRTAKSPELPIVLLEDSGAEIGLVFAIFGLAMSEITGNERWDAIGSVAIGLLLVAIAGVLAVEMKGLLIGEAASDDVLAALTSSITSAPQVNALIHLRTMHLGPEELLVAAKIDFDHDLTVASLAVAIDTTEASIRGAVPMAKTIYLEPDIQRTVPT